MKIFNVKISIDIITMYNDTKIMFIVISRNCILGL